MAKWFKKLIGFVGFAAAGAAAAGALYYWKKNKVDSDEFADDFDDEDLDFDLDNDLKPVTDREYVPLNKTTEAEAEPAKACEDGGDKEEAADTAETAE